MTDTIVRPSLDEVMNTKIRAIQVPSLRLTHEQVRETTSRIQDLKHQHETLEQARDSNAEVEQAKLTLAAAQDALVKLTQPFNEQLLKIEEEAQKLRQQLVEGWPEGNVKTIGDATLSTRNKVVPNAPAEAAKVLIEKGMQGAITDLKVEGKALLPFLTGSTVDTPLSKAFTVEETKVLTVKSKK